MWSNMLKYALLPVLMRYLESYWTEFHQTFRMNVLGSKGQRSRSQHDQGRSGWRRTELDIVQQVLISSFMFC